MFILYYYTVYAEQQHEEYVTKLLFLLFSLFGCDYCTSTSMSMMRECGGVSERFSERPTNRTADII